MNKKYIIISLFGYRSIVSEEKRNAFLKVIYDGVTINKPKCFEKFINNTKNKLWKEVKNDWGNKFPCYRTAAGTATTDSSAQALQ